MAKAKRDPAATLRNIGIIAHIDAGKTTLTERILYYTGRIHRMGEVHDGAATMDFMPEEQERGITISSACTHCKWGDTRINIIDTPGHVDFTIEVARSLRVLDGAVGVFCGVAGVEPQSEMVWRQSLAHHVAKLAFINKMDRPGADFEAVLTAMRERLDARPLPLTIPDGQGQEFAGVFDLLRREHLSFSAEDQGTTVIRRPLEADESEMVESVRERTLETLAEEDDAFMEMYLSGEEPPLRAINEAIRRATLAERLTPVLCGSALRNVGVQPLLDAVRDYLPSPLDVPPAHAMRPSDHSRIDLSCDPDGPLACLAFKVSMETGRKHVFLRIYSGTLSEGQEVFNSTQGMNERAARLFCMHAGRKEKIDTAQAGDIVAAAGLRFAHTGDTLCFRDNPLLLDRIETYTPVISLAIEPRNADEGDKLSEALGHFLIEDPTLSLEPDAETGQLILSGMGELHLEIVLERLHREYNLTPRAGKPQAVCQETIRKRAEFVAEFDRMLGDKAHYGSVRVSVEPRERGAGNDVIFAFAHDGWPEAMVNAVDDGLRDGLQGGVLGWPVSDVLVRVLEMQGRERGATDVGMRMAAAMALKGALREATAVLLEPLMAVEISVPGEFVGEVVSLFGQKGAKIDNMFDRPGLKVVRALAPLSHLFGFSTDLRSATQGRAGMTMRFERFDILS